MRAERRQDLVQRVPRVDGQRDVSCVQPHLLVQRERDAVRPLLEQSEQLLQLRDDRRMLVEEPQRGVERRRGRVRGHQRVEQPGDQPPVASARVVGRRSQRRCTPPAAADRPGAAAARAPSPASPRPVPARHRDAGGSLQPRPAARLVDIRQIEAALLQELAPAIGGAAAELLGARAAAAAPAPSPAAATGRPAGCSRTISVATRSSCIEQPAGQEREAELDLLLHLGPRGAGDRAVAQVEAELPVRLADEVEHGHAVLALVAPQAAAELLQEDEGALGRPQEQDRVDLREVDALVEQVDGEERPDLAGPQVRRAPPCGLAVGCPPRPRCDGRPASVNRRAMNSACAMLTQNPSARIVPRIAVLVLRPARSTSRTRASSAGVELLELGDVVALARPRDAATGRCCRAAPKYWNGQRSPRSSASQSRSSRRCGRRSSAGCRPRRCAPASRSGRAGASAGGARGAACTSAPPRGGTRRR